MYKFYSELTLSNQSIIDLNPQESWHACKVLRLKANDKCQILNGKGEKAFGTITDIAPKVCKVELQEYFSAEKPKKFNLLVAPPKSSHRWEFILEKAQEFNVNKIQPVLCKNSERKKINLDKAKNQIRAALKQCGSYYETEVVDFIKFNEVLKQYSPGFFGYCNELNQGHKFNPSINETNLFIGPEGDLSDTEAQSLFEKGWKNVILGKNILRTESAALAGMVLFENNLQ